MARNDEDGRKEMLGISPRRTRYAGAAAFDAFPSRKRFKKGGTSAPPSIDPFLLGGQQLNTNLETAKESSRLSNVNTTSPLGTSTFTPGENDQWNLSQTLSPALNTLLYGQQNLATTGTDVANRVGQYLADPAQAGIRLATAAANTIGPQAVNAPAPSLQPSIDFSGLGALPTPNVQSSLDFSGVQPLQSPNFQSTLDFSNAPGVSAPNFQRSLNFSGLGRLSTNPSDFAAPIRDAERAAYNSQAAFLDPQFAQKSGDLRQQLADQGIGIGTDAYSRAQDDLGRQQTLAYQQAQNAAVAAGQEEQARLFGQQLSGRQQGAQEIQAGGQFTNAAQQALLNAQLANRQQRVGETTTAGQFANAAQQQSIADTLAARQQQLGQVQAGGQFANAAEQQRVADILAARQQGSQELATGANFRNATAQQLWQDPLTALSSLAGTGSGLYGSVAQDLATMAPLSNFSWAGALPTFGGSPTAVSPANIVGAGQVATNAAANRFAAGNTLNNQLFNGLGSLGGALGLGNGGLGNALGIGSLFGGASEAGGLGGLLAAGTGALEGTADIAPSLLSAFALL